MTLRVGKYYITRHRDLVLIVDEVNGKYVDHLGDWYHGDGVPVVFCEKKRIVSEG